MGYVAMLTARGTFSRIPQDHDITNYEELTGYMAMLPNPFMWFEPVRVKVGKYRFIMAVDEEGLLKDDFEINKGASRLYGGMFDVIAGDVLFFSDHSDSNMYALTDEECDVLERAVSSTYTTGHNENETVVVII